MKNNHSYNPMHFLSDKHCGPRKRVAGKGGMVQSCNTVFESKGSISLPWFCNESFLDLLACMVKFWLTGGSFEEILGLEGHRDE